MKGSLPRHALPALDGGIDVFRIELDAVATPSRLLRGKDGGAAAAEGIKDDIVAAGHVEDRIRDHRERLDGWVMIETRAFGRAAVKEFMPG